MNENHAVSTWLAP